MNDSESLEPMLKLALVTAKSQHKFFTSTANKVKMPEAKALLLVLAESEFDLVGKIQHMIATGILDELEELNKARDRNEMPDSEPFDPSREETDPRIFICNKALDKSISSYKLYLTLATRSKSEVVSRLFEYLAYLKMKQIERLRRVCETY